jgi:putative nucleotidyltransferase with HDIG domain
VLFVTTRRNDTPAAAFARLDYDSTSFDQLTPAEMASASCLVFDVDLADKLVVAAVRRLIGSIPSLPPVIFAVDRSTLHYQVTQANTLRASATIERPLDRQSIEANLLALRKTGPRLVEPPISGSGAASIEAAHKLIGASFGALCSGAPIELDQAEAASRELFRGIGQAGLNNWLDTVRAHHAGTFQHCLLVTGAAVAYASYAGLPERRRNVLTVAALLHDIGKASIPNEVLDKPGELSKSEMALIRTHPRVGANYLRKQPHLQPAVIDAVLHHHEFLDGSGYPDKLIGGEISPTTRIITVCDIYGALIEQRAYKPAKTHAEALYVLIGMALEGKLDYGVVRTLAAALGTTLPAVPA